MENNHQDPSQLLEKLRELAQHKKNRCGPELKKLALLGVSSGLLVKDVTAILGIHPVTLSKWRKGAAGEKKKKHRERIPKEFQEKPFSFKKVQNEEDNRQLEVTFYAFGQEFGIKIVPLQKKEA